MRNVTITLDEDTARWARVAAARQDTSVTRFVGELLRREMVNEIEYERAQRSWAQRGPHQLQAKPQAYPARDDLHGR